MRQFRYNPDKFKTCYYAGVLCRHSTNYHRKLKSNSVALNLTGDVLEAKTNLFKPPYKHLNITLRTKVWSWHKYWKRRISKWEDGNKIRSVSFYKTGYKNLADQGIRIMQWCSNGGSLQYLLIITERTRGTKVWWNQAHLQLIKQVFHRSNARTWGTHPPTSKENIK